MYEEIKCQNCKYFDDIMLMEECKGCALAFSKQEQTIKFIKKWIFFKSFGLISNYYLRTMS